MGEGAPDGQRRDRLQTSLTSRSRLVSVGAGRKEIWEVWKEAKEAEDEELLGQAAMGALQLGFNNKQNALTDRSV